jgi:hypothetical protein
MEFFNTIGGKRTFALSPSAAYFAPTAAIALQPTSGSSELPGTLDARRSTFQATPRQTVWL